MHRRMILWLLVLGLGTMLGCSSGDRLTLPDVSGGGSNVQLQGQVVEWTDASGQSLDLSGTVVVRETQARSGIAVNGAFQLPLPAPGIYHLVFRKSNLQGQSLQAMSSDDSAEVELEVNEFGEVKIKVRIHGNNGEVVEKVHLHDGKADLEGSVQTLPNGSNSFQLLAAGMKFTIRFDASTRFINVTPDTLEVGMRLEVKGRYTDAQTVDAEKIRNHDHRSNDDDDEDEQKFEAKGTVTGLTKDCTTGSGRFTLEHDSSSDLVYFDSTTEFKHTSCEDLADGDVVKVEARTQTTGTVGDGWLAHEVNLKEHEDQEDEFEEKGTITSLSGTCPDLTFTLAHDGTETELHTDATTEFEHVTCEELAVGMEIKVEARRVDENGSEIWLAKEVKAEDHEDEDEDEFEAKGTVAELTKACPDGSFYLEHDGQRTLITFDSTTKFEHTSCDELADGDVVKVESHTSITGPSGESGWLAKKIEKKEDHEDDDD